MTFCFTDAYNGYMAATLKVKKIEKFDIQAQNDTVLDVTVGIIDNGQEIEERRLNFPLNTTKDELTAELSKFISNYNVEVQQAVENAERDAAHAQADEVIGEMTDMEITGDESVADEGTKEDVSFAEEAVQQAQAEEVSSEDVTFEAPFEPLTEEVK